MRTAGAIRRGDVVRGAVVLCGVALAASWWLFDPAAPDGGRTLWIVVTVAAGCAGLLSAARVRAFFADGDLSRGEVATATLSRTIGDAVILLLIATAGMAVRAGISAASSGWSADLLRALITTPIATFVVFVSGAFLGGLIVVAVGGLRRVVRMPPGDVAASTRWFVGAAAALAIATAATIVVGLTDTSPATQEGTAALVAFLVGPVALAAPWQAGVLWLARVALAAVVVCLVAAAVSRRRER